MDENANKVAIDKRYFAKCTVNLRSTTNLSVYEYIALNKLVR